MNMPAFTAEASLYKTSGHYRTGRHTVNSSARMISSIWPALKAEDEGEVIEVHGCRPGYTLWEAGAEWGCTLVEPPTGGGDGGVPTGDWPDNGGGGNGDLPDRGCKSRGKKPNPDYHKEKCDKCKDNCKDFHPIDECHSYESADCCEARKEGQKKELDKCIRFNCNLSCAPCI